MMTHRLSTLVRLAALVLLCAWSLPAVAEDDPRTAGPDYTYSYELDTTVAEVWDLLTTADGMKKCGVAKCEADFRPGGTMKNHYDPNGTIGDENTIVHHIDAVEPYRMYAARVSPPANGGVMKLLENTRTVVYVDAVAPDRTRVTFHSFGWGEGAEWDTLRKHFDLGNDFVTKRLRAMYGDRDRKKETKETFVAFAKLEGDWIGKAALPNGETMRIHNRIEKGPGGRSLLTRGTMRIGEKTWLHADTQIWVAAGQTAVRFHSLDERGGTATGSVVLEAENRFVWDWQHTEFNGTETAYRVLQEMSGADAYSMRLQIRDDEGSWKDEVVVAYERVAEVPEEFRTPR